MAYYSPQVIADYIKTNNLDAAGVAAAAKQFGVSTGDLQLALPTIQKTGMYADQNHDSVGSWGNTAGLGNAVDSWAGTTPLGGQTVNGYDFSGWNANDINGYAGIARDRQVAAGSTVDLENGNNSIEAMLEFQRRYPTMTLDEQGRYQNAAANDPRYQWAVKNAANTSDKFDDIIAANPTLLGQLNDRAFREDSDPDAFKDSALGAYYAGQLKSMGNKDLNLAPSQLSAGENWNNFMSAEAQARRDPGQGIDSPLGMLAAFAAIALSGGAASGALGAGAGAGATATELAIDAGALGGGLGGTTSIAELASMAGQGGLFGAGGVYGTGLNTGSSLGNTLAEKTISNTVMNGGDVGKGLTNSVMGLGTGLGTAAALGSLPSAVSTGLGYAGTASKLAGVASTTNRILNPAEPPTRASSNDSLQNGLTSMYSTALGRAPTQDEMSKWTNMANQGFSPQDIVNEFKKSPEFLARRPT